MNNHSILLSFEHLGTFLTQKRNTRFEEIISKSHIFNPWFTSPNVEFALHTWSKTLDKNKIQQWHEQWKNNINKKPTIKKIGIVMAGNIPVVGLHDLLCVLASGNIALVKLSSKDDKLIPYLVKKLIEFDIEIKSKIKFINKLENFDAVIATGSNNTSRYFESYFGKYPHIIRKNRTSVAVLNGNETLNQLKDLSDDIFTYFGLGCRNISKLFVPNGYDFGKLMESFQKYSDVLIHNKYMNNYEYNKAMLLLNQVPHLDNGFILLKEDTSLFSPTAVLHYEYYNKTEAVIKYLEKEKKSIQCVVSTSKTINDCHMPGKTQFPELWDYADQINTMNFLQMVSI